MYFFTIADQCFLSHRASLHQVSPIPQSHPLQIQGTLQVFILFGLAFM